MRTPGRSSIGWWGAVALAAAAGLWAIGRRWESRPSSVLTLGDGSRIRVLGLSHGTNHMWVSGRFPFLDPVRRGWRPIQFLLGSPTERHGQSSEFDALCVFHSHEDELGRSVPDPYWIVGSIDEHGCRIATEASRSQFSLAGSKAVLSQNLECYPRRQTRFGIEFAPETGASATNRIRMELSNRRPWEGGDWTPERLPLAREIDGLRLTLLAWEGQEPWPWPRFRIEQGGVERPEWELAEIWFLDVTGNRAQSPTLCRHEPAWTIQARFRRKPETLTDPACVWELGTFDLPEPGTAIEIGSERELQGTRVRPLVLGGSGVFQFAAQGGWHLTGASSPPSNVTFRSNGISTRGSATGDTAEVRRSEPWMAVRLAGLQPDQRWNVVAVDEEGRVTRNSGWSGLGGGFYAVNLGTAPERRRFTLRLVVDRVRLAEFVVPPPAPRRTADGR